LGVHADYILSLNHNFPAQNIFTSIYVQYIRSTGYSPPGIVMSCDARSLARRANRTAPLLSYS
jgi:hypothetical protein